MKIGEKEYSEILVTDSENNLLVSITDENIIEEKDCKVVYVPAEKNISTYAKERELLHNQLVFLAEQSKNCTSVELAEISAQMIAAYSVLNQG